MAQMLLKMYATKDALLSNLTKSVLLHFDGQNSDNIQNVQHKKQTAKSKLYITSLSEI